MAYGMDGIVGQLAHATADHACGWLDPHGAIDHRGAAESVGGDVGVVVTDGRTAIGAHCNRIHGMP